MSTPKLTTHTKEQFWQDHFSAWEASGLSQTDYCKQHDLKYANFTYWRTRNVKKQRKFLPLSPSMSAGRVILDLPHGIRLEIPEQSLGHILPTVLHSVREAN